MTFEETLAIVATLAKTEDLRLFAAEDNLGGFHKDGGLWPVGSMWEVEGRTLYALVRALRPLHVLELGTNAGCSATHILAAMKKNGVGALVSVDFNMDAGRMVPAELRSQWTLLRSDAMNVVRELRPSSCDIIFEDLMHCTDQVEVVANMAKHALVKGGLLISHDAMHPTIGAEVRGGYRRAGLEPTCVLAEPSDCGLAIWRKPD